MNQLTTRLLLLALIATCCFAVSMSFWSPTAVAQSQGTYCDDHEEEEFEGEISDEEAQTITTVGQAVSYIDEHMTQG